MYRIKSRRTSVTGSKHIVRYPVLGSKVIYEDDTRIDYADGSVRFKTFEKGLGLFASSGDIKLHKFVLIPAPKIEGISTQNYNQRLQGYFYLWGYTYNTVTKQSDDRMKAHSDVIDNLPSEIRRYAKELTVWGKTDWFKDRVRFTIVNEEYITNEQVSYIQTLCSYQGGKT